MTSILDLLDFETFKHVPYRNTSLLPYVGFKRFHLWVFRFALEVLMINSRYGVYFAHTQVHHHAHTQYHTVVAVVGRSYTALLYIRVAASGLQRFASCVIYSCVGYKGGIFSLDYMKLSIDLGLVRTPTRPWVIESLSSSAPLTLNFISRVHTSPWWLLLPILSWHGFPKASNSVIKLWKGH